jgi:hypothetical protein
MPDVRQVVSLALRVDKAAIPLPIVPRTAPSESQVRPTSTLFMVDRNAAESPSFYELRLAVLASFSLGILGDIRCRWCCRSSDISLGRCAVRTERYWDESDKVIRKATFREEVQWRKKRKSPGNIWYQRPFLSKEKLQKCVERLRTSPLGDQ